MSLEIFASGYFFLNFHQYKPQNLLTRHPPLFGPGVMTLVRPLTYPHVWETVWHVKVTLSTKSKF